MTAIVLAGGFGTRLKSMVKDIPKPMAEVNGKVFLEYIFDYLIRYDFKNVILAVGYKADVIVEYFQDRYKTLKLKYSYENSPLGTGGAIAQALKMSESNEVFILNGDTFFDVNLNQLYKIHMRLESDITLSLKEMKDFDRYGIAQVENEYITKFEEKRKRKIGLINGGIYLLNKNIIENVKKENFSFEEFLESNIDNLKIGSYVLNGYFIDIGIPEDYIKANKDLK